MATSRAPRPAVRSPAAPLAAWVLHSWDWSETSLIVELFTRERGRVAVAAKGAKRPTSQLRPVLLPFQRLAVTLGRTPADEASEIHTLKTAEWGGLLPAVHGAALFAGFHLNELLLKLLARQDPHERLFDWYGDTLAALASDEAAALRAFELVLLRETGVLPELAQQTLTLAPLERDASYTLHPEAGLVATRAGDGLAGGQWLALEAALAADAPAALRAACAEAGPGLRAPLAALVQAQLGAGRLRTRELVRELRRLG